jgi:hypothetical protein
VWGEKEELIYLFLFTAPKSERLILIIGDEREKFIIL